MTSLYPVLATGTKENGNLAEFCLMNLSGKLNGGCPNLRVPALCSLVQQDSVRVGVRNF